MTLKVAELHHCAVRIPPGPDAVGAALRFYNDVIGLESDHVPWDRAGENQRINAGSHAQVHLVPGVAKKALATGELDLSSPHLAFAVAAIDEAQAELDRLEVPYRVIQMCTGVAHWYRPEGPLSLDKITDQFGDIAVRMVAPAPGGRNVG